MNAPDRKEIIAITAVAALTLPERAAVAMLTAEHELKLRALVASSADIVAVIDAPGREQAHRIGMNLKGACVAIEKVGKTAREDATAFSKAIIFEEKRLTAIAEPEKLRVLALRDGFDDAEQARKDALIAQERAAMAAIQSRMDVIRDIPSRCANVSAAGIHDMVRSLSESEVTIELFGDQFTDACDLKQSALGKLLVLHDAALASEAAALAVEQARIAEAARMAVAAEQLAIDQAALAEQQRVARIESDRIAAEQAAEASRLADLADQQRIEAQRIAAQAAAEQAERDRITAKAQRKMDEQQAAITAQLAALQRVQDEAIARQEADEWFLADLAEAMLFDAQWALGSALSADIESQREQDHLDSLAQDDGTASLARYTATEQEMLTTGHRAEQDKESLAAFLDTRLNCAPITNDDIVEFGREWELELPELVDVLEAFCRHARAELMGVAA